MKVIVGDVSLYSFVVRSSSVSQTQTNNNIQAFTISIGFQQVDGKRKPNTATEHQTVTLPPHSQLAGRVYRRNKAKVDSQSHNSSLFWHPSGGTSSLTALVAKSVV